jgi:hypothetical protein
MVRVSTATFWCCLQECAGRLNPAYLGDAEVHDDDIWSEFPRKLHRPFARASLDVLGELKQNPYASPDGRMIIGHQDSDAIVHLASWLLGSNGSVARTVGWRKTPSTARSGTQVTATWQVPIHRATIVSNPQPDCGVKQNLTSVRAMSNSSPSIRGIAALRDSVRS